MKLLSVILLINILALHTLCDDKIDPEPFTPSTEVPTSTPVTTPPTSTTTPAPTTPATTSPTKPTTTTPPTPSTTTTLPTTSTATTTPAPPTTSPTSPTTPMPSPTTTPAPPPKPEQGTWNVTNTTNQACILVKMVAIIEVNYTNIDNKIAEGQVNVPIGANSTGSCGDAVNKEQYIEITWPATDKYNNSLTFIFNKTDGKFDVEDIYVNITLDSVNFPNAKDVNKTYTLAGNKTYFSTPEKMSYKCDKDTRLPLNVTTTNVTGNIAVGILKISLFQYQAFGNITKENFAEAKDCEPYETPDIVPIAVGCALMALIIIVLIGYLIGRRRNQARGYLSM